MASQNAVSYCTCMYMFYYIFVIIDTYLFKSLSCLLCVSIMTGGLHWASVVSVSDEGLFSAACVCVCVYRQAIVAAAHANM